MIGAPYVDGAEVVATVEQQTRGGKLVVFKMKRRKGYRRTHGEAPYITILRINDIVVKQSSSA
jgi:large subunit ribosomal protein L21